MKDNAYVQQLVKHLVGLKERYGGAETRLLGQGSLQWEVGKEARGAELPPVPELTSVLASFRGCC